MYFNPQKMLDLKEKLNAIKEINDCVKYDNHFLFIKKNDIVYSEKMTCQDMENTKYLIAMSPRYWQQLGFTNKSMMVLGMFDENLQLDEKIPLPNGYFLIDIKFERYKNSYYDEYKPIFVIEEPENKLTELTIDREEEHGYSQDFNTLYKRTLELK